MAEYIKREDVLRSYEEEQRRPGPYRFETLIESVPSADVAPVQHGRWIVTVYTTVSKRKRLILNKKFACSECSYSNGRKQSNYCKNCGAKMDLPNECEQEVER